MASPMTTHQLLEARAILPLADARSRRSAAYVKAIAELAAEGAGAVEIADRLQRTAHAIRNKAHVHGIRIQKPCRPYQKAKSMNGSAASATTSAAAMRAQVVMMRLLDDHFDGDKGVYADGWCDQRVAKESSLSLAMVQQFRIAGFGDLKTDPELERLQADLQSLKVLFGEEIAKLEARVLKIGRPA